jgi:hypothetical protein
MNLLQDFNNNITQRSLRTVNFFSIIRINPSTSFYIIRDLTDFLITNRYFLFY